MKVSVELTVALIILHSPKSRAGNHTESFPSGKMATELFPKAQRSQGDFTVDKLCECDNDHEKTVDFLVGLLSNGDIGRQRDAAEALTVRYGSIKKTRDRIRYTGATAVLVERLSSPDVRIREHMITLLYYLADDDEDNNSKELRKSRADGFRRTIASRIHTLLRIGRGTKVYETAARLLINLSNVDGLKDSLASSGAIEALIDVLRYKKGLKFQRDTIKALTSLLRDNGVNIATAAKRDLAIILVQLLMHGDPNHIDIDGILGLIAVLAHEGGREEFIRINGSPILTKLLKSGKLAAQQDKVAMVLRALNGGQNVDQITHENGIKTSSGKNEIRTSPGDNEINISPNVPSEFRCPISGKLMKDPVMISTGQTYDREFIQKWFDNGNRTCYRTRQPLGNLDLKTNILVKFKIAKWRAQLQAKTREIAAPHPDPEPPRPPPSNAGKIDKPKKDADANHNPVDSPDERPPSLEELSSLQSFLDVLSSEDATEAELRAAALGLHDLAFSSPALREAIAVAGAISPLSRLLSVEHKESTQDAGIATLLILSLNKGNKKRMVDPLANAVPAVVRLLRHGSEDCREKAASTLFSLSILDENKVSIGATDAIPALVDVLSGNDPLSRKAQKDAATCLLTLCIWQGNKAQAVRAGVVPHLLAFLDDEEAMLDLVFAMLAVLSSHVEGCKAIEDANLLPTVVEIMRSGSDRNIANALMIFSNLIKKNPAVVAEAERLGADETVLRLCEVSGPGKIQTKTLQILDLLDKHHS